MELLSPRPFGETSFPPSTGAVSGAPSHTRFFFTADRVHRGRLKEIEVEKDGQEEVRVPSIAIIGKPNVGKSSILNALVGEERSIVSPVSGTTRDAIDTVITRPDGQAYCLIDTAGIRRRAGVAAGGSKTEELSVNRAFRAIRRADVVALVIDAMACITEQDWKLSERIIKEGKGCIIVVNKWDTVPEKNNKSTLYYEKDVREKLPGLEWAPIVFTSAVNSSKVTKILEAAIDVENERSRRLTTAILNQVVHEAMALIVNFYFIAVATSGLHQGFLPQA